MPGYELLAGDPTLATLRRDPEFVRFINAQRALYERRRALLQRPS